MHLQIFWGGRICQCLLLLEPGAEAPLWHLYSLLGMLQCVAGSLWQGLCRL
jgi:hypothetical protein